MMQRFHDLAFGDDARRHQRARGSFEAYAEGSHFPPPDGLGEYEIDFLQRRDSFYLSSVGENGWPYVQHRGGPPGFITVVDPTHIAWADRAGNKQFVTAGHLDANGRIAMIAVDYPNRQRLKLFGNASFDPEPDPAELERLGISGRLEGLVRVEVVAFDWNCPKYITPRYTEAEFRALVGSG
jgi:predicted pyridoxine 5'-phosphate oxidase superfamily flavin-nucleotide-binding protein